MAVSAAAGAIPTQPTQQQSTTDDVRSNLAALVRRRSEALPHLGSAQTSSRRAGASIAPLGPAAETPPGRGQGVEVAPSVAPSRGFTQPRRALLKATAQSGGREAGQAVMQALSLAQASELDLSIWGQGVSQAKPMSAQERKQWISSVMQDLSQKQALSQADAREIARSLYLQPGNDALATKDIRAGILAIAAQHKDDPERAALEVLRGALVHRLSVQQMVDTGLLSAEQVDHYLQSLFTFFTLAEWDAVRAEAIVPALRPQLKAMGLTGAGVRVRVLEVENWGDHPKAVTGIINHPTHGLAPGAIVGVDAVYNESHPQRPMGEMLREAVANSGLSKRDPQAWVKGLRDTLISAVSDSFRDAARKVRNFAHKSAARILNMSFGSSLTGYYELVDRMLVFYPKLYSGFYADTPGPMSQAEQLQKIIRFVNDTVLGSERVLKSYQDYVNATSEAVRSNKTIVVAAGNWQDNADKMGQQGVGMPPWAAMNVMAMSPHVIAVGASSTNGTPNNLLDDKMAPFSSNGSEQFPISLATQGVQAAVSYVLFLSFDGQVNGSSFSAPLATAVIALMLEKNPRLRPEQIKSILQATATDTPAVAAQEGAGMLDVMKAVESA